MDSLDDTQAIVPAVARPRGHGRLVGAGLVAAVIGIVATILVAASTVAVLPTGLVDAGSLAAVALVAVPLGLALGLRYREQWVEPTFVAGVLLAGFLVLRGQAFVLGGQPVSYPLLFGLPGAAVALAGTVASAWVGRQPRVARRLAPSQLSPLARAGLLVAGAWTVIELLFGLGVAATVGSLVDSPFVGVLVATIVGFPVAAGVAVWYGRRVGIDRADWDYRVNGRIVVAGLAAGVLTVLAVQATGALIALAGWSETAIATFGFVLTDLDALWVVALFVLAHGVVAPLAEELAWRGVVQTALVDARGPVVGIAVTAALFTAKHALLDASLARVPTVLVLAVALGVVRHRWGTSASTLVHVIVNTTSVLLLVVLVGGL